MKTALATLSVGVTVLLVSATSVAPAAAPGAGSAASPPAASTDFSRRVLATGLSDPFEVVFGPDRMLWVTERTAGRVTKVDPDRGAKTTILCP